MLTVCQIVKKFPTIYGSRRFIPMCTTAHHFSLACTTWTQPMPSHPTSFRLSSGLFDSGYPIIRQWRHRCIKCCTSILHLCAVITWDDWTRVKRNWRWCLPCNKKICNWYVFVPVLSHTVSGPVTTALYTNIKSFKINNIATAILRCSSTAFTNRCKICFPKCSHYNIWLLWSTAYDQC